MRSRVRIPVATIAVASAAVLASCSGPDTSAASGVALWLHATRGQDSVSVPLAVGHRFQLAPFTLDTRAVRPWRGLLMQRSGVALVHFAARPAGKDWIEDLVLKSGDRIVLDGSIAIEFLWSDSPEPLARDQGRWGLREGTRTTWSESFTPGTGFEREDGAVVTLVEQLPGGAIRVALEGRTILVPLGGDVDGVINASRPDAETTIRMRADEPGIAMVTAASNSAATGQRMLRGDTRWFPGVAIRLHDVQPDAVYVPPDASPWIEAVLLVDQDKDRVLRVRENALERLGNWQLRVSREAPRE